MTPYNYTYNGQQFAIALRGTVGLMCLAERRIGEPFNPEDKYHMLALFYTALIISNKKAVGLPTLDDFIETLTTSVFASMNEWFWATWRELEGPSNEGTETKDADPKND